MNFLFNKKPQPEIDLVGVKYYAIKTAFNSHIV